MKKITFLILAIVGLAVLFSCEKKDADPILDISKSSPAVVSQPASGTTLVLTEDLADSTVLFSWSAAAYNLSDLESTKYSLQIDLADSSFANAKELANTTALSYTMTVEALNNALLGLGMLPDSTGGIEVRVISKIITTTDCTNVTSATTAMTVTTYLSGGAAAPPLYLIGDGTTTGWDNTNIDLQFSFDADAEVYKIVATLGGAGKFFKAFEVQGQWAPQWGTDATGTSEGGPLVYRPTETEPDPAAIPTPELEGDYLIVFDLVNMVYTVELADIAQSMHIIGDATEAGWDNTVAVPMEKLAPGKFQLVTTLSADATEGFKFLVNQGAWAPMYGTVEGASLDSGVLVYRETESDPDPKSIPPPSTTGTYLIEMNVVDMTYSVTPQ